VGIHKLRIAFPDGGNYGVMRKREQEKKEKRIGEQGRIRERRSKYRYNLLWKDKVVIY